MSDISVISRSQRIIVDPASSTVSIINVGPMGPPGPTGPPGPAGDITGLGYRHVQSIAATTWDIVHTLPYHPNVAAVDSTGNEIWPGAVQHLSATNIRLLFSSAVGGEAYLT